MSIKDLSENSGLNDLLVDSIVDRDGEVIAGAADSIAIDGIVATTEPIDSAVPTAAPTDAAAPTALEAASTLMNGWIIPF